MGLVFMLQIAYIMRNYAIMRKKALFMAKKSVNHAKARLTRVIKMTVFRQSLSV
jgi:hypothetical protein